MMTVSLICLPIKIALIFLILLCFRCCHGQILDQNGNCQLVALIPFTDEREGPPNEIINGEEEIDYYGYGYWPNQYALEKASFSYMATLEMAVSHFNNRNPIIVPQLSELNNDNNDDSDACTIQFSSDVIYKNSGYVRHKAVQALMNITNTAALQGQDPTNVICAVIGPTNPRSAEGVSAITENLNIPQLGYNIIDVQLSRQQDFPTFARIIPSSQEYGFVIANYIQRDVLKRDYLAIIYDSSDYGEQYEDPLEDAEDYLHYATITEGFVEENVESISDALDDAVEKGFHSIFLATDRLAVLDDVARIAEEKGLLGEEYLWFVLGDMLPPSTLPNVKYKVDSPTDKLLRGAAMFTNYDPYVYDGAGNDKFLQVWKSQNDTLMERVQKLHPFGENALYNGEADYFQNNMPTEYSSFLYDSVIATGISACNARQASTADEKAALATSTPFTGSSPITRTTTNTVNLNNQHVQKIYESDFLGASGYVQFAINGNIEGRQEILNGRDVSGVKFGMHNIRPGEVDSDGMRSYEAVLTHVYTNETQVEDSETPIPGSWRKVNDDVDFIYFDGTTNPPMPLKTTEDSNYLSKPVQRFGCFALVLGLLISLGTYIWVYTMRKHRLVTAAQPEFLYLLCFGSTLVSLSLLCISFDEDKGFSEKTLSKLCSAFPWLFVLGYNIMYCALFCKLFRLNKLLSMRRKAVKVNQVMVPFAIIITFSIIVLIIWQVVDPFVWTRRVISGEEDAEDPLITYGECNSGNVVPYITALGLIIAIEIIMTGVISWKLKDVQAELSESKWIFFGIFSHLQIWVIGIPLYVILDRASMDASYLISVALVFILSSSMVMFVIWPKIYLWARDKWFPDRRSSRGTNINVTRSNQTHVSGLQQSVTSNPGLPNSTHSCEENQQAAKLVEISSQKIRKLAEQMEALRNMHEQERDELQKLIANLKSELEEKSNELVRQPTTIESSAEKLVASAEQQLKPIELVKTDEQV